MNQAQDNIWQRLDIRLCAVAVSLLVSLLNYWFPYPLNDDGFTFIRTAQIFQEQGLSAAIEHYPWAAYPLAIGLLSKLLAIELMTAAYLLNAVFYALLVYAWLSIVREIDSSRILLALAAIVILVYPQLNENRSEFIRDIGFVALVVTAIWQMIRFWHTRHMSNVVGFTLLLLLATSLRIEGLVYLLFTPWVFLLEGDKVLAIRFRTVAQFLLLSLVTLVIVVLLMSFSGYNLIQLALDFVSTYVPFITETLFPSPDRAMAVATALFNDFAANYSKEYILPILLVALLIVLAGNLFNAVGGPFLLVILFGLAKKYATLPRRVALPVMTFMLCNLVILFCFVFITRYLTSRYALVFSTLLILLVPVIMQRTLEWAGQIGQLRLIRPVLVIFLLYCAFDAYVSFGENKAYLHEAADWVRENSPPDTALLTNSNLIAFDSGRIADYDMTERMIPAAQIIAAVPGTLIAVELNYAMVDMLAEARLATRIDVAKEYFTGDELQLVVYRRNAEP